jgi:predicted amidophosphoribosyltransferase
MPYVPAICPNCGADLSIYTEQEKGYCSHCGCMIDFQSAIQNAIFTQPIEFEGYESYATLVGMIDEDLKNGENQTPEFRSRLNRAIELNPDDRR